METGKPSRTAHLSAFMRAQHQAAPEPLVFVDPLAAGIAVDEAAGAMTEAIAAITWPLGKLVVARHRFAEDAIARRAASGLRQVVILGAGLDTFGYRNPHDGVRVFEVDHPDTQAWKRKRLADADIEIPGTVTFVEVDFESQSLRDELEAAGFRPDLPTYFVWLGVIYYLRRESALATIRLVAAHESSVELAFDYTEPPAADLSDHGRELYESFRDNFIALGDPWLTEFAPAEIAHFLADVGLDAVEDLAMPELFVRYGIDADTSTAPVIARVLSATRSSDWQALP